MPRFRPLALVKRLPSTLDGVGSPKPYETPAKIAEPNPRRRLLYVENVGGDGDPLRLCADLTPKGIDDTLVLESDSFAAFGNINPLVLAYSGLIAGLMDSIPTRIDEGFHFAELVDDVDAPHSPTRQFRSVQFSTAQIIAQPGPLFQPIKVYEAQLEIRFLRFLSQSNQIVLTTRATPTAPSQGFRLPTFFPLMFQWPYIPRHSLFAFDAAGLGARLLVTSGYA